MKPAIVDVDSKEEFEKILASSKQLIVVHFWTAEAPQCQQINDVLSELAKTKELEGVKFVKIKAESLPEIFKVYNISAAPTCILFVNKQIVDLVEGADPLLLTKKVKQAAARISTTETPETASGGSSLEDRLKNLINKAQIMVFMKGSPEAPRCGFSRTLVGIFQSVNAKFETFDILEDEEVRQGLKVYSNWPTYPQVYVKGNLIGGLDIIKELLETGDLEETLQG